MFKEDSLASKKFILWVAFPTTALGAEKNILKVRFDNITTQVKLYDCQQQQAETQKVLFSVLESYLNVKGKKHAYLAANLTKILNYY